MTIIKLKKRQKRLLSELAVLDKWLYNHGDIEKERWGRYVSRQADIWKKLKEINKQFKKIKKNGKTNTVGKPQR